MTCTRPIQLGGFDIWVPCRKCIACRIAISREWTIRLLHERQYHKESCFITLTFSEECLPKDQSLHVEDAQKFMKRLRWAIEPLRVKYFLVGEYGDLMGRPHYHAIIFGLGASSHTFDRVVKGRVIEGPVLSSWSQGFVYLGSVEAASCRYVTDYIFKAFDGQKAREEYGEKVAPFKLLSKGLGLQWVKDNQQYLSDNMSMTYKGSRMALPRYYMSKLDERERISLVRSVVGMREKERSAERLKEHGINASNIEEYLDSSRLQRDLELRAMLKRKKERKRSL